MNLNSLTVQKQDLYNIIEMITTGTNNRQFTSLKKFHTRGSKKIVYRTYYNDKSSIFVALTLTKDNCPVDGIFDINTHKQSKKSINGTYRIEFFTIGSLNGKQTCIANLFFISRKGIKRNILNIALVDSNVPHSIEDLDIFLNVFEEKICNLTNRTYIPELFKVSTIYSQIGLLSVEKSKLKDEDIAIVDDVIASLTTADVVSKIHNL